MVNENYLSRLRKTFDEAYPTDVEEAKDHFLTACRLFTLGDDGPLVESWVGIIHEYGERVALIERIREANWDIKNALCDILAISVLQAHDLVSLLDAAPKLALQISLTGQDWLKDLEKTLATVEVDAEAQEILRTSLPLIWGEDIPERLKRFAA